MKIVLPNHAEIDFRPSWDTYTALQLLTELQGDILENMPPKGSAKSIDDLLPITEDIDLVA
jgi:hypothetical protein